MTRPDRIMSPAAAIIQSRESSRVFPVPAVKRDAVSATEAAIPTITFTRDGVSQTS